MPIGFSPQDTATIRLACIDKDKPEADRARFKFRFLTSGQAKQVERLRDAARAATRDDECDRLLNEAIRIGLLGWDKLRDADGNIVPFAPAPPEPVIPQPALPVKDKDAIRPLEPPPYDVLDEFTLRLKFQMTLEYPRELLYTDAESFRSGSPSPAGTASSAKDAPADSASTSQP